MSSAVHPLERVSVANDLGPATNKSLETNNQKSDMTENDSVEKLSRCQTTESGLDLSYYFDSTSHRTSVTLKRGRSLSAGSTMSSIINQYQEAQHIQRKDIIEKQQQQKMVDYINGISLRRSEEESSNKVDKSNVKAFQFFGGPIRLNISIKEIKEEGLRALLYSSVPLAYFLCHLLNEYCSENLFFYLAVENYQQNELMNLEEKQQYAMYIMKTYLSRESDLEVNLEDKIYRQIQKCLVNQNNFEIITGKEFEAAKTHVFSLLNVSYHQFRTSSLWDVLESKCNAYSQHNKDRLQSLAVNLLMSFTTKLKNNNPTTSKLVSTFCKLYLPIGYQSYIKNKDTSTKSFSVKSSSRRSRSKSLKNESRKFITSTFDIFKLTKK